MGASGQERDHRDNKMNIKEPVSRNKEERSRMHGKCIASVADPHLLLMDKIFNLLYVKVL